MQGDRNLAGEKAAQKLLPSQSENKTFQRIPRSCLFYFADTLKINVSVALRSNILIFFILKWLFILKCFVLYCTLLKIEHLLH